MGAIVVKKPDGSSVSLMNKKGYSVITKAEQKCALMGEDTVTISVESKEHLGISVGDTINVFGRRYTCNSLPSVKRADGIFTTDMVFEGVAYDLLRVQFRKLDAAGAFQEGEFPLIGTLSTFTTLLLANIKRVLGSAWAIDLSGYTGTESKTISFNNENALAVLQRICEEFGQEFDITDDGSAYTIHVRKQGQVLNDVFEYGRGKGLYELTRKSVSNKALVTRLYVYGGKDNIKAGYRGYSERLKFSDAGYIDADSIKDFGIIEGTKIFEDIYPNRIGKVTAIDSGNINAFVDSTMDFDLKERDSNGTKWLIAGTPAKIHFNTGRLAGYEFEVTDYDHATKRFKIATFKDERGDLYPSPKTEAFRVAAGDEYVILDIIMPDSYVAAAEAKLKDEAIKYLQQVSQPNVEYDVRVDRFYLDKKTGSTSPTYSYFVAGDLVQVKDTSMKVEKSVRLLSFSRDLLDSLEYVLSLGDTVEVTRIERMLADINKHDTVIVQNDLGNPARTRRRARATEELRNMIFDTDGYLDNERIRPLSIETSMLSVRTKSQDISVRGLGISWVNRDDANALKFNAGSITNLTIEETLRTWNFDALTISLVDNDAYYIYARCSQVGTVGTIVLTKAQRKVDAEAGYYWIMLGIVHSIMDGSRDVSLTYGSTDVNGRFIRTGRLTGNGCFFDLDTGEIEGKVSFKSGSSGLPNLEEFPALNSSISSAQSAATSAASTASAASATAAAAQSDAASAKSDAATANAAIADMASDGKLSPVEKQSYKVIFDGYTSEKAKYDAQAEQFAVSRVSYDAAYDALNAYLTPLLASLTTTSDIVSDTFISTLKGYTDARTDLANAIAAKAKTAADNAQSSVDNLQVGGRNIINLPRRWQHLGGFIWNELNQSIINTEPNYYNHAESNQVQLEVNNNYVLSFNCVQLSGIFLVELQSRPDGPGSLTWIAEVVRLGRNEIKFTCNQQLPAGFTHYTLRFFGTNETTSNLCEITKIKLEKGNKASDHSLSQEDIADDAQTKSDAAKTAAIAAAAVDAQNRVDNLQFGGRNYLRNSGNFKNLDFWTSNGANVTLDSTITYNGQNTMKIVGNRGVMHTNVMRVKPNTCYTVSAVIRSTGYTPSDWGNILHIQNWRAEDSGNVHQESDIAKDLSLTVGVWKRIYYTFKTCSSSDLTYIRYYFYAGGDSQLNVANVMLLEGNKATDWTPAPEDNQAQIDALAYLKTALQNDTYINGGLVSTTLVKVGAQNVNGAWVEKCGINGAGTGDSTVRIWAGGSLQEAITVANGAPNTHMTVITEGGKLFAVNAEISGNVNARNFTAVGADITAILSADSGTLKIIGSGPLAGIECGLGRYDVPNLQNSMIASGYFKNNLYNGVALYIESRMDSGFNVACRSKGNIISDASCIGYGCHFVTASSSTTSTQLDIKKGNQFVVNGTVGNAKVVLPQTTEIEGMCNIEGIYINTHSWAVRVVVNCKYNSNSIVLSPGYTWGYKIKTYNGTEWDSITMGPGDSAEFLLCRNGGESWVQIIDSLS